MLQSKTKSVEEGKGIPQIMACITRYNPERAESEEMLTVDDITDVLLKIPKIGVIPECKTVLVASNNGVPVIHNPDSPAGQAYDDMVARFLGEDKPYRFMSVEKGWLKRIFGA